MRGQVSWRCHLCDMAGAGTNWSQLDKSAAKHNEETRHPTAVRTVGSIRHRDATGRVTNTLVGGGD